VGYDLDMAIEVVCKGMDRPETPADVIGLGFSSGTAPFNSVPRVELNDPGPMADHCYLGDQGTN
jgi:hypothetical protein